jgi:hypothetical protein
VTQDANLTTAPSVVMGAGAAGAAFRTPSALSRGGALEEATVSCVTRYSQPQSSASSSTSSNCGYAPTRPRLCKDDLVWIVEGAEDVTAGM